jgi:hypothetical protein
VEFGALVISLDFELYWGVRDKRSLAEYGRNILGGRQAIPRMLDLFAERDVGATWATVGFVFCGTKDELMAARPPVLPRYADPRLSPFDFSSVGRDESADPFCGRFAGRGMRVFSSIASRGRWRQPPKPTNCSICGGIRTISAPTRRPISCSCGESSIGTRRSATGSACDP